MRTIISEDSISTQANSRKSSRNVEVTPYAPNYAGVNQLLYTPSGGGQISFLGALGQMSSRAMAERQAIYDKIETTDALATVDEQFQLDQREFVAQNPSGKGYTEFSTGRYQELQDIALSKASNADVQNNLRLIFSSRSADIANNAFKAENEMFAAYTIHDLDTKINTTLNDVMLSPGSVISLNDKLNLQLSTAQSVLGPEQFLKYAKEKNESFVYNYGLGLVKQNPANASAMLTDERFKGLPPNKLDFLRKQASLEIEALDRQAKHEEYMQQKALARDQDMTYLECQIAIARGDFDMAKLSIAEESGTITREQRLKLELKMEQAREKQSAERDADIAIDKAIELGSPTNGVSARDKCRYLDREFEQRDNIRSGAGQTESTISAKVQYLQANSVVFDCSYNKLCTEIESNIRYAKDASRVLDACVAISGDEIVPAIAGVSDEFKDFAKFAVIKYKDRSSMNEILEERDRYFNVSPAEIDANRSAWRTLYDAPEPEKREKILKDFYKGNGYRSWFFVDSSISDSTEKHLMDAHIYAAIKRVFEKTGSMTKAHAVANDWFKNCYKKSSVNGDDAYMLNPPTEGNTGLPKNVIDNIISISAAKAATQASQAGMNIRPVIKSNPSILDYKKMKESKPADVDRYVFVRVGDREEKRKLHISAASATRPVYNLYYLMDENDIASKEYILSRDGTRAVIDFDAIKSRLGGEPK